MIEQDFGLYVAITLIVVVLLIISNAIPFYGFMHKRWKGCMYGCLVQPVFIVVILLLAYGIIDFRQKSSVRKLRKAAMVTLRKTEKKGKTENTHTWYLKPDEECFYEYKITPNPRPSDVEGNEDTKLFDIVPLDSFSVCVDDRIIVKFDLESRRVTASEDDESIEVVRVDWDKVNSYFSRSPH
ncbi:MAG: hypothetical protein J5661_06045 [Bacteroidaceae bacterium]|nr:hypothetical protein [Bacteroidaceae bacterium]